MLIFFNFSTFFFTLQATKRKLETDQSAVQPRKSMRIDHNQKKAVEVLEKERKAFEAEERLRKLAENSELSKKSNTNLQKLSLAQKILRSKNISLKKKNLVKKPITKKKIQMVLETVKRSAALHKPSSPKVETTVSKEIKNQEKKMAKTRSKTLTVKVSRFQRDSKKNVSQRQRKVRVLSKSDEKTVDNQSTSGNESNVKNVIFKRPRGRPPAVRDGVIPKKNSRGTSSNLGEQEQAMSLRSGTNRVEDANGKDLYVF